MIVFSKWVQFIILLHVDLIKRKLKMKNISNGGHQRGRWKVQKKEYLTVVISSCVYNSTQTQVPYLLYRYEERLAYLCTLFKKKCEKQTNLLNLSHISLLIFSNHALRYFVITV